MAKFQRLCGPMSIPHYVVEEVTIEYKDGSYVITRGPDYLVMLGGILVGGGSSEQDALAHAKHLNEGYLALFAEPLEYRRTFSWAEIDSSQVLVLSEHTVTWNRGKLNESWKYGYRVHDEPLVTSASLTAARTSARRR